MFDELCKTGVLKFHDLDRVSEELRGWLKRQFMEHVSPLEAHGQAGIPTHEVAREWAGQDADIAAERSEHRHVVALATKGMVRKGSVVGRDGLHIGTQLRQVVLLDMRAKGVNLSHESARNVLSRAAELLVVLDVVRDKA